MILADPISNLLLQFWFLKGKRRRRRKSCLLNFISKIMSSIIPFLTFKILKFRTKQKTIKSLLSWPLNTKWSTIGLIIIKFHFQFIFHSLHTKNTFLVSFKKIAIHGRCYVNLSIKKASESCKHSNKRMYCN